MYERMLDKKTTPTYEEMREYCGVTKELFISLHEWLSHEFDTESTIVFPYGNHYGWGVAHKKKKKLLCNIFPEENAFTVMIRLSNKQFNAIYGVVQEYMKEYIDNKYPCGDGGWIHYRVTCVEQFEDIKRMLEVKCS